MPVVIVAGLLLVTITIGGIYSFISSEVVDQDDIDQDGVSNLMDSCYDGDRDWTSSVVTDHDGDGCRDASEDEDDDKDGAGVDDLLGEDDAALQAVFDEEDVADESEDGEERVEGDDDLSAGISQEEMTALLGDGEEDQEPQVKAKPKAKAKKKSEEPDELEIEDAGNGEESISQDEIDALFG